MAELKDSGARRDFNTGAVRDVAEGKGRCDLLPLEVVSKVMLSFEEKAPIAYISGYIRYGNVENLIFAIRSFVSNHFENIYTALLEVAKQYEDGARKYNDRNWEKGMPLHHYIDSGVRHYLKFLRGDKDEPHDRAFIWNMLGAIWTHENKPELIDLPFANKPDIGMPITDKPSKWEGMSNDRLQQKICQGRACRDCPIFYNNNGKRVECYELLKQNPEEARKLMFKFLEGRDKK